MRIASILFTCALGLACFITGMELPTESDQKIATKVSIKDLRLLAQYSGTLQNLLEDAPSSSRKETRRILRTASKHFPTHIKKYSAPTIALIKERNQCSNTQKKRPRDQIIHKRDLCTLAQILVTTDYLDMPKIFKPTYKTFIEKICEQNTFSSHSKILALLPEQVLVAVRASLREYAQRSFLIKKEAHGLSKKSKAVHVSTRELLLLIYINQRCKPASGAWNGETFYHTLTGDAAKIYKKLPKELKKRCHKCNTEQSCTIL